MGKEYIKVNENWNVLRSVAEMRKQAEEVEKVHTIYVVDDDDRLKGRLSLKKLLTTSTKTPIKEVYNPNIHYVSVNDSADEVARMMQKYDLFVIPVIDELGTLVGQITIDDVVDYIKEEAEKDYQMAAGISEDVEANDKISQQMRARLPWLIVALIGGFISVVVLSGFGNAMNQYGTLFFFTPLIAATAGNVGVQSSAIVVQGLANGTLTGSVWKRLLKEISLSLLNGLILAVILLLIGKFLLGHILTGFDMKMALTVAISLVTVIMMASLIGTFIPLFLHKQGIDPAVATGPFITTSNDIFGIYIFFTIAKLILGF
jgi:magnesium transporter